MDLDQLKQQFTSQLSEVTDEHSLSAIEVEFLGRKGKLTAVLKGLSELDLVEKKRMGAAANELKEWIATQLKVESEKLKVAKWVKIAESERLDINSPLNPIPATLNPLPGHVHPISNFLLNVNRIFQELGYEVVDGYEIETDYYCFEALGLGPDHPARDEQDTFYLTRIDAKGKRIDTNKDKQSDQFLLRTQTSPMQVRYMKDHKPPIKIISPGKTFRRDNDATHTPMFHQFECLVVDEGITLGHLKSALLDAMKKLLGENTKIRFRTNYFPFVEPGLEVDVTCSICGGAGCNVCKNTGWVEMLGAGMVHPDVLRAGGVDSEKYSGFAFGTGVERVMMMKYAIPNLKLVYENDIRFLEQF